MWLKMYCGRSEGRFSADASHISIFLALNRSLCVLQPELANVVEHR